MRDLKTLLEILKDSFIKDWRGSGLCNNIVLLRTSGYILTEEAVAIKKHIKKDMYKRFGKPEDFGHYAFEAGYGSGGTFSDAFTKEIPLRIEWIDKMINELN